VTEYEAARAAHAANFPAYQAAIAAYRNREIGDAEYLAARAKNSALAKACDDLEHTV